MSGISRRTLLGATGGAVGGWALGGLGRGLAQAPYDAAAPEVLVSQDAEPMCPGPFEPTWASLGQYRTPDWFRDAKFGIWAHWGPQCQPEAGDWYARNMYMEGSDQYRSHVKRYGHPSKFGFKDVIHEWKAEKWDPARLVALYKRVGAKYFFAMGSHHDNLDMWDSKYQSWNSVAVGPKRNLIGDWAAAARSEGLPFGVSIHASHAWMWYETAQGADREGSLAGVPYDGKLTKADGAGLWWEGLDPQELYAQNHKLSSGRDHGHWHWRGGVTPPDVAYCTKFYNRTVDLINKYEPELLYFDDTALPLWAVSDAGLRIAAHFYNQDMKRHDGKLDAVLFGKILDETQRQCMVWDIERGTSNRLEPFVWQTDTCLGGWHYDRGLYERRGYKSAATVIHMLADIVSKNGNLLLNVPVRGDGTIDELEEAILEEIGAWLGVNGEALFATRPWKVFGEGPALAESAPLSGQGFNEGKGKAFTAEDVRFTTKEGVIYAILLGTPAGPIRIASLGKGAGLLERAVQGVELVGGGSLAWVQEESALVVTPPDALPSAPAIALRLRLG